MAGDCPSLADTDLVLSTPNTTVGTTVYFSCDQFAHRPSEDDFAECLANGTWSSDPIPSCEWSWDFTKKDKIIFGTSVAAVLFLIIVAIVAIVAYLLCYKKRGDELDERMFGSSQPSSSPITGYNGPYDDRRDVHIDPYVTYQDVHEKFDRYEGYQMNGTTEKPWLGFIPRPKVSHEAVYG